jgi:hypothetical protein
VLRAFSDQVLRRYWEYANEQIGDWDKRVSAII